MKQVNYLQLVKTSWKAIVLATLLFGSIGLWISGISDALYESKVELLIIQTENSGLDSYAAQRSAEKLGNSLTKVVYSSDFLDKVLDTELVSGTSFSDNSAKRKKEWAELIKAQVVPETGIIKIYGYGNSRENAQNTAVAAAWVLSQNASDYHGAGDNVVVKVIDSPITSTLPAKPNIILNTIAALVFGLISSIIAVIAIGELQGMQKENMAKISQKDEVKQFQTDEDLIVDVEYNVLDHTTFPNFEYAFAESSEPITMFDHIS